MKSEIIRVDNQGDGFAGAIQETQKICACAGLNTKDSLRLQLCAEEMLSMARSVTGEMKASFWLENEGRLFTLHMSTKTVMDKEKRYQLISASSSRRNEAANTFLGRLRDAFEAAMAAEADHNGDEVPAELWHDMPHYYPDADEEGAEYEKSVLRKVADDIKIFIRGGYVEMTISKRF